MLCRCGRGAASPGDARSTARIAATAVREVPAGSQGERNELGTICALLSFGSKRLLFPFSSSPLPALFLDLTGCMCARNALAKVHSYVSTGNAESSKS